MIKTFELYLILLFAKKILNTFLIFFTLIFILNLFEEINFFKDLQTNPFFPIILSGLNAPATLFEIFPFIFLIGTQFFFLDIIDKNELEILKINGLSNIRILKTLFITSLLFGFILITIFYTISAKLQFIYFDIKNSYSNDDKYLAVVKESGLWIKDEIDNKIYIINADEISNNSLINVSIHEFNTNLQLIHIINSEEIDISSYEWILSKPILFKDNKTTQLKEKYFIKTHFDIKKINSLFNNLSSLNVFQLLKLRNDYSSLGNSTREVDIHLHKLYSLPLFISIMTILSSIIMFNNKRNTSIIFHLLSGILFSVIVYYLSYLSYLMGENGKIPIILSTYLPFMILILISLISSKEIDISSYEWILTKPLFFKDNKTNQLEEKYLIKTHFDIKKINSLFSNLYSLNFSQLLKLRNDYRSLGNSTREVDIHLHKLYSLPLFISIMTVFSSIIMFNNKRNTSIIFHLLSGILLSVIVYYLSYLSYLMGENGKIPIILSTYLPIVILILITLIGSVRLNEK